MDSSFKAQFDGHYRKLYSTAPEAFTNLDFIGALGSVHDALLYSKLFVPDFIEIDDMVFLADVLTDSGGEPEVKRLLKDLRDPREVEATLNYFDLALNLPNRLNEMVDGDDRLLAGQIATAWRSRLRDLYPTKTFFVNVDAQDGAIAVVFHQ
ncbi:MAG: hypothetical protein WDO18_19275 [Acidobacteriota bacterium]